MRAVSPDHSRPRVPHLGFHRRVPPFSRAVHARKSAPATVRVGGAFCRAVTLLFWVPRPRRSRGATALSPLSPPLCVRVTQGCTQSGKHLGSRRFAVRACGKAHLHSSPKSNIVVRWAIPPHKSLTQGLEFIGPMLELHDIPRVRAAFLISVVTLRLAVRELVKALSLKPMPRHGKCNGWKVNYWHATPLPPC